MAKIYIAPKVNDYATRYNGAVLVFDYVESMSHTSTASLADHPVEFQNSNIADHRFHQGQEITLTGNISDNWQTDLVINPTPVFQTIGFKGQKELRRACVEELGTDSPTCQMVNYILDGNDLTSEDNQKILNLPKDETYWATEASRLVVSEQDTIEIAQEKGLSVTKEEDNASTDNRNINQVGQAVEMLQYIDDNDIIVRIHSLHKVYDNMVLLSFNNTLRNGPQRGAYWVSLTFRERLMARTTSDVSLGAVSSSEFISDRKNLGTVNKPPLDSDQRKEADNAVNLALGYVRDGKDALGKSGETRYPNIEQQVGKGPGSKLQDISENAYSVYYQNIDEVATTKVAQQKVVETALASFRLIAKGIVR